MTTTTQKAMEVMVETLTRFYVDNNFGVIWQRGSTYYILKIDRVRLDPNLINVVIVEASRHVIPHVPIRERKKVRTKDRIANEILKLTGMQVVFDVILPDQSIPFKNLL